MNGIWLFLLMLAVLAVGWVAGWMHHAVAKPTLMGDIVAFHEKFGLEYDGPPRILSKELSDFRIMFMGEEMQEYVDAEVQLRDYLRNGLIPDVRKTNKVDKLLEDQLDALIDLTYVTLGTAYLQFGHDVFMEGWRRVQVANMAKVRKDRAVEGHKDSGRAAEFDVVKPAGWTAPTHIDLIRRRHD